MFSPNDPNVAAYTRMMYGQNAIHIPFWMFTQDATEDIVSFVGASKSLDLRFGATKEQRLVLGDMIIRPHLVVESDIYRGHGLSGLATASKHDFLTAQDVAVLLDPIKLYERISKTIRS